MRIYEIYKKNEQIATRVYLMASFQSKKRVVTKRNLISVWTRSGLASRSLLRPLFPDDESHISNLKLIHHTSCLLSEEIDEKLFLCYVATTRKRYKYYRWLTSFNDYESIVLWCVYFLIINRSPHRVHLFHYSPPPIIQVIDWVKIVFFTASKSKCSLYFFFSIQTSQQLFSEFFHGKKSI
jgi:hypothetical protein